MLRTFTDQMNREVVVNWPPKRIVSLVPSQTELLYELGLDGEIVGQTLFCIHPSAQHATKPRVGGTKKLNLEAIRGLHPDLIIGNKEENEEQQIHALMQEFPVWMSDIKDLNDALHMIRMIGDLTGTMEMATLLDQQIQVAFDAIQVPNSRLRAAYLIWRDPYMAAGHDTFIHHMMHYCGFDNVFANETSRYPEISTLQLQTAHAQVILLSSEPYPFREKHIEELRHYAPKAMIELVDGELFSWYGSRLLHAAVYLNKLASRLHHQTSS